MNTTIWKVSAPSPAGEAAGRALREAGIGLLEKGDWDEVTAALHRGEATLVVADAAAVAELADRAPASGAGLPTDLSRRLSHDLRTPLSAMAGWLHLMQSGKLDGAGLQRAIAKLQENVDNQVRVIEKYLGGNQEDRH